LVRAEGGEEMKKEKETFQIHRIIDWEILGNVCRGWEGIEEKEI
jgi:hypothetical protein